MKIGWVSIHRKIQDHWLYEKKRPRTKYEAWLDILFDVNHEDQKVLIREKLIQCKRGQSIKSLDTWAKQWKWDKTKVRRFFVLLQNDNMIVSESYQATTRISVINYNSYQDGRNIGKMKMKSKCNASVSEDVQNATRISVINNSPYKDDRNETETKLKQNWNESETKLTPNNNVNNKIESKELSLVGKYLFSRKKDNLIYLTKDEINNNGNHPKASKAFALLEHIDNDFVNVAKLKRQLTFCEAEKLIKEYDHGLIDDTLNSMENYALLTKKSTTVYLTVRNWISRRKI